MALKITNPTDWYGEVEDKKGFKLSLVFAGTSSSEIPLLCHQFSPTASRWGGTARALCGNQRALQSPCRNSFQADPCGPWLTLTTSTATTSTNLPPGCPFPAGSDVSLWERTLWNNPIFFPFLAEIKAGWGEGNGPLQKCSVLPVLWRGVHTALSLCSLSPQSRMCQWIPSNCFYCILSYPNSCSVPISLMLSGSAVNEAFCISNLGHGRKNTGFLLRKTLTLQRKEGHSEQSFKMSSGRELHPFLSLCISPLRAGSQPWPMGTPFSP